jgi:hypothetical protein
MKKYIYHLIVFCFISNYSNAQNWQWAKQVGSNIVQSYDGGNVITDGTNYYLIGWYSGSIYLSNDTLNSNGNNDLFIIKYDANGNELWAKGFGGNSQQAQTYEITNGVYDPINNCIYLTGIFYDTMYLDAVDTLNTNNGNPNIFITRMDLNGNFIWGQSIVTNYSSPLTPYSNIFCSNNGTIYLSCTVADSTIFNSFALIPGGCLLKFDANGNCTYARNLFSGISNQVRISFIGSDLILSGAFQDSAFHLDTANILNNGIGTYDSYISRTDSSGNVKWIKHFGYGGTDVVAFNAVDNNTNEIYFCGSFQDSIKINSTTLYNMGKDILFCKIDANGNTIWNKQCYSVNNVGGANSLCIDNDGNFYAVGFFSGNASFGSYSVSTSNTYDMFLTRYNSNGDCLGVRHFGYASSGRVVVDNNGNPICSGGFFNTITIGSNTFTSYGYVDLYLAKSDIFTGIDGEGRMANNQLIIYANPNQGKCNITVPDDFLHEKNLTLSIYDNTGKFIQQKNLEMNDGKIKLNLEAEAKGIYSVTLSNSSKSYNGKIIFE